MKLIRVAMFDKKILICLFIYLFICLLIDWLIDWLINWSNDWLIDWLIGWFIDRFAYSLFWVGKFTDSNSQQRPLVTVKSAKK